MPAPGGAWRISVPELLKRAQSSGKSPSMGKEPNSDDQRQRMKLRIPSKRMLVRAPMAASKRMSGATRRLSVAMKKTLRA